MLQANTRSIRLYFMPTIIIIIYWNTLKIQIRENWNPITVFSQCTVHLLPVRSLSLTFTLVLRGFLSLSLHLRLLPPTQSTRRALSFIEYIISFSISIIIASNNGNNDDDDVAEAAITTSSVFRSWRWLSRYPFGKISWPIPFDYRTLLLRCCCYCSPDWRTSGLTDWRHSPGRALFSGLRSSINCLARKSIIDIGFALMIIAANWVSGMCDGAHCLWHCLTCSASLLTLPLSSTLCLSFYLSDLPAP